MPRTSPFTCVEVLLDQEAPVDDHAAGIGDAGRGEAGIVLAHAAVDRIDVDGRLARPVRHHRHGRAPAGERRIELRLEGIEHGAHVADGAVAEERHGAVGDAPLGLDLRPPHAAMAEADAVLVERLGDDDVVDARPRHQAPCRRDRRRRHSRPIPRPPCPKSRWRRDGPDKGRGRPPPPRSRSPDRLSCRRCRGHRCGPSRTAPPKGSKLQPAPASTTSIWPLK